MANAIEAFRETIALDPELAGIVDTARCYRLYFQKQASGDKLLLDLLDSIPRLLKELHELRRVKPEGYTLLSNAMKHLNKYSSDFDDEQAFEILWEAREQWKADYVKAAKP